MKLLSFFLSSGLSLLSYISDELTRDYMLEHNQQKLKERRKRVYTFVKTPKELEKVNKVFINLCRKNIPIALNGCHY